MRVRVIFFNQAVNVEQSLGSSSVVFLNVQGLKKKVHALEYFLISSNILVICFSKDGC